MVDARRTGFGYVDVIVALLVVSIIAAAAYPSVQGFLVRFQLEQAAARLASDLRWARFHALRTRRPVDVVFDVEVNSYEMPGTTDPLTKRSPLRVQFGADGSGVQLVSVTFQGNTLSWSTEGLPSEAGTIELKRGRWQVQVNVNAAGTVVVSELQLPTTAGVQTWPLQMVPGANMR